MLLLASCIFYMAFVPVYILILAITIIIDYVAAIYIDKSTGLKARLLLVASIISTCLVLFVFKYFNFFAVNFNGIARLIHWNYSVAALHLLLPIGLSFHTFQSLSYVVEVYRKKQKPEKHFGIYALYVMFYPQLVAGPIERPQNLLHQFREPHPFNYDNFTSGLRLMAWGLFKKSVIADRVALYVNDVYGHPRIYTGTMLALATFFFAYQIYCDFSGYSDMAIGAARVMGFKLMTNFRTPYYSKSISEFWHRWHISLSTWFRDYVYIPLGGSRVPRWRWYLNLVLTFTISGFWHGANWTYVAWGFLNGLYLCAAFASGPVRQRIYAALRISQDSLLIRVWRVAFIFVLTNVAWVLFRAASVDDALYIYRRILSSWDFSSLKTSSLSHTQIIAALAAIALLESIQLFQRRHSISELINSLPLAPRWGLAYGFIFLIVLFGIFKQTQFIYFQF